MPSELVEGSSINKKEIELIGFSQNLKDSG
jgi:hypothetical protein